MRESLVYLRVPMCVCDMPIWRGVPKQNHVQTQQSVPLTAPRPLQVSYFVTLGCAAVSLCRVRHANALAKWLAGRRRAEVSAIRANFLCCLMPLRVFQSRMSSPVAPDQDLVVEPLEHIFVMFCSLPDFASLGAKCSPGTESYSYRPLLTLA